MADNQFDINIQNSKGVIANKKRFITTSEIYKTIYTNQLLEVFKLSVSFVLSYLILKLIENILLDPYKNNHKMYSIILIVCIISLILIAGGTFTYLKITNEKDNFLQQVINKN
jgi:hypothetical protein